MKESTVVINLLAVGFLSLTIAIGVGRFLFTPILPYMESEKVISFSALGTLATWNYIGYFLGALVANKLKPHPKLILIGLVLNSLTTLLMGLFDHYYMWVMLRFLSGISSGIIFVLVTFLILRQLSRMSKMQYSGYVYGGVGFGILVSGFLTPLFIKLTNSSYTWVLFGLICLAITIYLTIALTRIKDIENQYNQTKESNNKIENHKRKVALYISYLFEGFGYIVYATFITGLLTSQSQFTINPSYVWAIVGIGAIPSCILWSLLGNKISDSKALKYAYLVQMVSVIIPIITDNLLFICVSALLFGGTFLGIITLTMTISKQYRNSKRFISGLTAIYALGQMVGPLAAGYLIEKTTFQFSFLLASLTICISFTFVSIFFRKDE